MTMYEVYLPANQSDGEVITERGITNARFLSERASIIALIIPVVWLIWHRLWWALAGYLLFALAITGIGMTHWAPATMAFTLLPGIYFLLEGPNWIADKWQREGYVFGELVDAQSEEDAELKWIARQDLKQVKATSPSPLAPRSMPSTGSHVWLNQKDDKADFGLFAED